MAHDQPSDLVVAGEEFVDLGRRRGSRLSSLRPLSGGNRQGHDIGMMVAFGPKAVLLGSVLRREGTEPDGILDVRRTV